MLLISLDLRYLGYVGWREFDANDSTDGEQISRGSRFLTHPCNPVAQLVYTACGRGCERCRLASVSRACCRSAHAYASCAVIEPLDSLRITLCSTRPGADCSIGHSLTLTLQVLHPMPIVDQYSPEFVRISASVSLIGHLMILMMPHTREHLWHSLEKQESPSRRFCPAFFFFCDHMS